jgi:DNA modification methylase
MPKVSAKAKAAAPDAEKLEVVYRKTSDLIGYARNARTHSEAQVAQIAASIREFGFTNPILLDGNSGILAGHGRVAAARLLGLAEVPTIDLAHLTETQRRAYILADNKLALNAGWDAALLKLELDELQELDFPLALTGFEIAEVSALEAEVLPEVKGQTDEDAVPEVKPDPVTRLGDVWLLGKHRVMCGDSTSIDAVEKLMAGEKAALLHADPPYGMGKEKDGVENDNLYREDLDRFQMEWWATFRTFLRDNASAYIWGNAPDLWRLWYRGGLGDSERLEFRNEITWDKGAFGWGQATEAGRCFARYNERALFFMLGVQQMSTNADAYWEGWEPIRAYLEAEAKRCGWTAKDLSRITSTSMGGHWITKSQWALPTAEHYATIQAAAREFGAFKRDHDALKRDHDALKRDFYESRAYFDNTHDNMTDVWTFSRPTGEERHGHATPKPAAMMERVMRSSLPQGGLCAEPFGGSGSTLMGAEKAGRVCFTMEITPTYCDVIVRRWQEFTGQQATLEGDGRTFDAVAAAGRAA